MRPHSSSANRKQAAAGLRLPLSIRSMKLCASSAQPGSSTVSACRKSSQSPRACAAPASSWPPRPRGASIRCVPAASAMIQVSSVEPPSTRIASCTTPSTTAGTSAARVAVSVRSPFKVGMITEIMGRTIAFGPPPAIATWQHSAYVLDLFAALNYIEPMTVALRKPHELESAPLETAGVAADRRHGRGAQTNRSGRYEPIAYEPTDDGWESPAELEALATEGEEVPA